MLVIAVSVMFLSLLSLMQYVTFSVAQQPSTPDLKPSTVDIKSIILSKLPLIDVEYQGESIVVLKGDENTLLVSNGTNMPFWNAIDLVKHYGYKLDQVTTSGVGSQGNPTRFYAIMSKP